MGFSAAEKAGRKISSSGREPDDKKYRQKYKMVDFFSNLLKN